MLHQAQQCGPRRHQRPACLLLGQPVQAAIESGAVLIEEGLELGTSWQIDDILSERRWEGGHKRSISGALSTSKLPLIGRGLARQILRSRQAVANHKPKEPPVLRQVAEGVLIHESEFCQSNAVVVHGRAGVLLIDPGVHGSEMAALANDLRELGQPVVAGFSTHPHWDHLLWHARFGAAPRYGTARCATTVRNLLSDARWKARVVERMADPRVAQITAVP